MFLATGGLVLSVIGCSPRQLMVNGFMDIVETGMPAFEQEDDLVLLADAMPSNIKMLETVLASDPDNTRLLVALSQLYGAYAYAVLETRWEGRKYAPVPAEGEHQTLLREDRLKRYFDKGADYALRALESRHSEAVRQLDRPRQAAAFLQTLDQSDVPALFWYGFNLGFFIQHNLDSVAAIGRSYLVEKTLRRVIELDPGYYYGNAHVALMVYYASRSPMMGGNPKMAAEHYRRHKNQWPEVSGLRQLYWARYYWVQQQKRDAFVQTLNDLVSTPIPDHHPLKMLEQVAVVRAKVYLEVVDQFFNE